MLLESDIRTIERSDSRLSKAVEWVVILSPVVLLVMADFNLTMASRLGTGVGTSLGSLVGLILNGVEIDRCYNGEHVMALEMLRAALVQAFAAAALAFVAWSYMSTRRMNQRILMVLRAKGAIESKPAQSRKVP